MASEFHPDTEYLKKQGWRFDFDTDRWYPPSRVRHMVLDPERRSHGFTRDEAVDIEKRVHPFIDPNYG